MFTTVCPNCGVAELLEVFQVAMVGRGAMLSPDGFDLWNMKKVATEDEKVRCRACKAEFDLSELTGEAPAASTRSFRFDTPGVNFTIVARNRVAATRAANDALLRINEPAITLHNLRGLKDIVVYLPETVTEKDIIDEWGATPSERGIARNANRQCGKSKT